MKILNLKYKMHKLVNYMFYVGIFIFGFLLGFTVKKIDFSEIVSQVLFIDSASAETITTCRDSVNLFNKNDLILGYRLGSDGSEYADNSYSVSDFITVNSSVDYTLSRANWQGSTAVVLYDENKNFISRFMTPPVIFTFTTTSDTKYVRIAVHNDNVNSTQFEFGSSATSYEEFGVQICEDDDNFYNFANKIVGNLDKENYWVYDFTTAFLVTACFTLFILVIGYIVEKIFGG